MVNRKKYMRILKIQPYEAQSNIQLKPHLVCKIDEKNIKKLLKIKQKATKQDFHSFVLNVINSNKKEYDKTTKAAHEMYMKSITYNIKDNKEKEKHIEWLKNNINAYKEMTDYVNGVFKQYENNKYKIDLEI